MITIKIGRDEMYTKASAKDIELVDWEATERDYARQLEEAFGNREITVEFSDVAPSSSFSGDYADSYDVQRVIQDVWDRQSFWKYRQYR